MQGNNFKNMMCIFTNFDVDIYRFSPIRPLCVIVVTPFPKIL